MGKLRNFFRDRRGNIVMVYGVSLPMVVLVVGFAIDFGHAAQLRTKLNAAADAAALAALTPSMMAQSNSVAQAAAVSFFNGQATGVVGLEPGQTSVTVTVSNPNNNALARQVTVCYDAAEATVFAGILGATMMPMSNCATAQTQLPPNIDFYLLLDNSPSMLLAATQAGITQLESLTSTEDGGCAFACHESQTNNYDTTGNTCSNGSAPTYLGMSGGSPNVALEYCTTKAGSTCPNGGSLQSTTYAGTTYYYCPSGAQVDNYTMARNNNITLRIDQLQSAVTTLVDTAQTNIDSSAFSPPPAYRFSISSLDSSWQEGFDTLMSLTSNFVSGWTSASSNFVAMEMYENNYACAQAACTGKISSGDNQTDFDNALSSINALMPNPGKGTNAAGDTPQEVLFFVTDGVEDELSGTTRLMQPINYGTSTNYCTLIKNRGIKIAIVYTEYLPLPTSPYYETYIAQYQNDFGPALQACASPGLFYDAAIGADLGTAFATLFQAAVQSANLTQ